MADMADLIAFCCSYKGGSDMIADNETFLPGNETDTSLPDFDDLCSAEVLELCDKSIKYIFKHNFAQIVLSFIALILNASEVIYLRLRKRKCVPSEFLLVSLAISDILFSLSVIIISVLNMVYERHHTLDIDSLNQVVVQLIQFSIYASMFHVLAISLERLAAVLFPIRYRIFMAKNRIRLFILVLWIATILVQGFTAAYLYTSGTETKVERAAGGIMYFSGILLCIIYAIIIQKVIKKTKFLRDIRKTQTHCKNAKTRKQNRSETVAFITALIVSIGFLLFTFPVATIWLFNIGSESVSIAFQCLLICNSSFNPVAYFWRGYWLREQRQKNIEKAQRTSCDDSSNNASHYSVNTANSTRLTPKITRSPFTSPKETHDHNIFDKISKPDLSNGAINGLFRTFTDKWDGHLKYC